MLNTVCTVRDGGSEHIESAELCRWAREALEDKKGQDLVLLDVRDVSSVTDYFLIATGTSAPHIRALAEELEVRIVQAAVFHCERVGHPYHKHF